MNDSTDSLFVFIDCNRDVVGNSIRAEWIVQGELTLIIFPAFAQRGNGKL